MPDDQESPLGRWSRRKTEGRAKVRAGAAAEREDRSVELAAMDTAPPLATAEDADAGADIVEQLPDIDDLDAESDYTLFMRDGVPENLRRLALRKLWLSDPVLANVDGLVDYGEDFSIAETLGGVVKTIYQVGKGMVDEAPDDTADAEGADKTAGDSARGIADDIVDDNADGETQSATQAMPDGSGPLDQV
ncbi:MAG: DUF3306 domain-containing protein [Proteobacteria bacterium]|nr:DUF3306 domain-containing protein [Pseudomonadota bacterium]